MGSSSAETKAWRQRIRSRPIPPDIHGLASTYSNYGCRCGDCRAANTEYCYRKRNP